MLLETDILCDKLQLGGLLSACTANASGRQCYFLGKAMPISSLWTISIVQLRKQISNASKVILKTWMDYFEDWTRICLHLKKNPSQNKRFFNKILNTLHKPKPCIAKVNYHQENPALITGESCSDCRVPVFITGIFLYFPVLPCKGL